MRGFRALEIAICGGLLCAALATSARADNWNKKTIVTFSDSVEVPGAILPPGTYVFKLAELSSSRNVVEIWNEDQSQEITTVLTVPAFRQNPPDDTLFRMDERPSNEPMALQTWFYPGDQYGNRFVYPDNEYRRISEEMSSGH